MGDGPLPSPLPAPPTPPRTPLLHLRGDELQPSALPILLLLDQGPHLGVALGKALLPRPARQVPDGCCRGRAMLRSPAASTQLGASLQSLCGTGGGSEVATPHRGSCQVPIPPKHPWSCEQQHKEQDPGALAPAGTPQGGCGQVGPPPPGATPAHRQSLSRVHEGACRGATRAYTWAPGGMGGPPGQTDPWTDGC